MKYLLSILLIFLVSCNLEEYETNKKMRCKKLKNNVIKYISIDNHYSPRDTIEWREYRSDSFELYLILNDKPVLKNN